MFSEPVVEEDRTEEEIASPIDNVLAIRRVASARSWRNVAG